MRREDRVCLETDGLLRDGYLRLSKKVGPCANVIGVFYHELMVYLTNYHLLSVAKEHYPQEPAFPYLNSSYVKDPYPVKLATPELPDKSPAQRMIEVISRFSPSLRVCIASSFIFDRRSMISALLRKGRIMFLTGDLIHLPEKEWQISILRDVLHECAKRFAMKSRDCFVENFINHAIVHATGSRCQQAKGDLLIVGSNSTLRNRILSANFLESGGKVITFHHGEQNCLVLDEPVMGYGEHSYATWCVSYGALEPEFGDYNKPLQERPEIVSRAAETIKKFYRGPSVNCRKIDRKAKCLYIPTLFSGNKRYGPFRDIEDSEYIRWQNAVMSLDLDMTYKAHPKSKVDLLPFADKVVTRKLEECIHEYDIYIIDYVSTASALVIATDKPVIYFNIGLRNLARKAELLMRKRVFWRDIDWEYDLVEQARNAIEEYNSSTGEFVNEFTEAFSLGKSTAIEGVQSILEKVEKQ